MTETVVYAVVVVAHTHTIDLLDGGN